MDFLLDSFFFPLTSVHPPAHNQRSYYLTAQPVRRDGDDDGGALLQVPLLHLHRADPLQQHHWAPVGARLPSPPSPSPLRPPPSSPSLLLSFLRPRRGRAAKARSKRQRSSNAGSSRCHGTAAPPPTGRRPEIVAMNPIHRDGEVAPGQREQRVQQSHRVRHRARHAAD